MTFFKVITKRPLTFFKVVTKKSDYDVKYLTTKQKANELLNGLLALLNWTCGQGSCELTN